MGYDKEFVGKLYGNFLKASYSNCKITAKQIVKGLCSISMLSQIENGKKQASWLLRERLLRRTGVVSETYETFLNCEDYTEWKMQKEILNALYYRNNEEMIAALKDYETKYYLDTEQKRKDDVTKRLRRQFYLAVKGIYLKRQKAEREELIKVFGEAVRLTVPEIDMDFSLGMVLCPEEINLILEYVQYFPPEEARKRCQEIQDYLQKQGMEDEVKVQNYPKAVVVLCKFLLEQKEIELGEYQRIIQLCDSAIILLRNTKKQYYLIELLEVKEKVICQMKNLNFQTEEFKKMMDIELMEIEKYKNCFTELNQRFDRSEQRIPDIWLYERQDIFCIGDVIRTRRKMLGMTMEELCQDICSKDTLQRLEHRKKSTQQVIVWELCRKMHLSPESEWTELLTTSPRARKLEKEIRYGANEGKFEENLVLLEELKTLIDMLEPINQQWILRTEGMAKYKTQKISAKEYENWLEQAIKCTLSLSTLNFPENRECYLTNAEMVCIYHLSLLYVEEDFQKAYKKIKLWLRMEQKFEETENEKNHIRSYELYMHYWSEILYKMGKYELSKQYIEKTISVCLQTGRINLLDTLLYDWMRNIIKLQKINSAELTEKDYDLKKDLQYDLIISQFCKNTMQEKFLKNVLKDIF